MCTQTHHKIHLPSMNMVFMQFLLLFLCALCRFSKICQAEILSYSQMSTHRNDSLKIFHSSYNLQSALLMFYFLFCVSIGVIVASHVYATELNAWTHIKYYYLNRNAHQAILLLLNYVVFSQSQYCFSIGFCYFT